MVYEQAFLGSLLVMSRLHKDTHKENYTLSLLLWWQSNMWHPHVAFEGIETIRKFPVLHEVTSDLIIVTITSSLAHHKYKDAQRWLHV